MQRGLPLYASSLNSTPVVSPVTLSYEWPTGGRLLFIVFCFCLGTIINGFFVAAFFVERTLRRVGNVFLACVGLSDLIITTVVMPCSAVVLLSGEWDLLPVCKALQFLTEASTYCFSLFFTLISMESYYRTCMTINQYEMLLSDSVGLIAVLVFIAGFTTAGTGVYLELDNDYCQRKHFGSFNFRATTSIIFYVIPFFITMFGFITALVRVKRQARNLLHYKRSRQYDRDYSITTLNMATYIFYVIAWTPYLIVVNEYPNASDTMFYHCIWVAIFRSVFTGFLYSALNTNFRHAFANLFYYCCCKTSMTGSLRRRQRRGMEFKPTAREVRVHIMHRAIVTNTPKRGASSCQETYDL